MRRRVVPNVDDEGVPAELLTFRSGAWLPAGTVADRGAVVDAVETWCRARRRYVEQRGYPDDDVLGWLRHSRETRRAVLLGG